MATEAVERRSSSAELADFVSTLEFEAIPADGVRLAERCFLDTTGVTLAGAAEGAGPIVAAALRSESGGNVSLLGREGSATVTDAAFVNGTAGHGLDFDDVSDGMHGHPSVPMVPALLGVGQRENSTGRELLTAFVAGFETQCYLSPVINPDHYGAGWHSTATLGTLGAAAAVARLLELDTEATRHALGTAASMAAGLKRNFGTTTKPIHAGNAARSGVTAALAAADGATADAEAIDGVKGFFELYAGEGGVDLDARPRLGERWAIVEDGVGIKKYPCCYFTHAAISVASGLADDHAVDPDDVESVEVVASRGAGDALHHEDPRTGLEGKFSMEYTVASAIARETVGLAAFDDENVGDPSVQRVRERVDFEVDERLEYGSHETTVRITTTDGDSYEESVEGPPGKHENPLSDAELEEKFRMCGARVFESDTVTELHGRLDDLRSETDVAELVGAM